MSQKPVKTKPYQPIAGKIPEPQPSEKHSAEKLVESIVDTWKQEPQRTILLAVISGLFLLLVTYRIFKFIFGPFEESGIFGWLYLFLIVFFSNAFAFAVKHERAKLDHQKKRVQRLTRICTPHERRGTKTI